MRSCRARSLVLRSRLEKDSGVCGREEEEKLQKEEIPGTPSRCPTCGPIEGLKFWKSREILYTPFFELHSLTVLCD